MPEGDTVAPVVPIFNNENADYLDTLVRRHTLATTMIWGWQGGDGQATRMVEPANLVSRQTIIPFLFSPTEQAKKAVTHAAISGLVVHRDDDTYGSLAAWLARRRVEHFSATPHVAGTKVKSFYVVTACKALARPIPYQRLTVASKGAPLSPDKRRGYALVWLPDALAAWFQEARRSWQAVASTIPR